MQRSNVARLSTLLAAKSFESRAFTVRHYLGTVAVIKEMNGHAESDDIIAYVKQHYVK